MITEETIEETRFYSGPGGKYYFADETETVIIVRMKDVENGATSAMVLGDEVCEAFAPVKVAFSKGLEPPKKTKRNYKKPRKQGRPAGGVNRRGPRKKFSEYPGVTAGRKREDGSVPYRAGYWNGKRNIALGTFDDELLAAAAVAEAKGDKKKAVSLRLESQSQRRADDREQAENNPDRPMTPEDRAEVKRTKKPVYVCKRCGLEYRSRGVCAGCGCDDMREVIKNFEVGKEVIL